MAYFEHAGAQLAGIEQQQSDLQRAVAAGELWMEAGVAERAADHCVQTVAEVGDWLYRARELNRMLSFGANEDGLKAAKRFAEAGQQFVAVMENAQAVFQRMAETYRAAGRTVAEADSAGQQMFQGGSG